MPRKLPPIVSGGSTRQAPNRLPRHARQPPRVHTTARPTSSVSRTSTARPGTRAGTEAAAIPHVLDPESAVAKLRQALKSKDRPSATEMTMKDVKAMTALKLQALEAEVQQANRRIADDLSRVGVQWRIDPDDEDLAATSSSLARADRSRSGRESAGMDGTESKADGGTAEQVLRESVHKKKERLKVEKQSLGSLLESVAERASRRAESLKAVGETVERSRQLQIKEARDRIRARRMEADQAGREARSSSLVASTGDFPEGTPADVMVAGRSSASAIRSVHRLLMTHEEREDDTELLKEEALSAWDRKQRGGGHAEGEAGDSSVQGDMIDTNASRARARLKRHGVTDLSPSEEAEANLSGVNVAEFGAGMEALETGVSFARDHFSSLLAKMRAAYEAKGEASLARLRAEVEATVTRMVDLQKELGRTRRQGEALASELTRQRASVEMSKQKLQGALMACEEAEADAQTAQTQMRESKKEADALSSQLAHVQSALQRQEKEAKSAREDAERARANANKIMETIEGRPSREEWENLQLAHSKMQAKMSVVDDDTRAAGKERAGLERALEAEKEAHEMTRSRLQGQMDDMESDLVVTRKQLDDARSGSGKDLAEATRALKAAEAELAALKRTLEEVNADLVEAEERASEATSGGQEAIHKAVAAEKEASTRAEAAEAESRQLQTELKNLKAGLATAKDAATALEQAEQALNQVRIDAEQAASKAASASARVTELEAELERALAAEAAGAGQSQEAQAHAAAALRAAEDKAAKAEADAAATKQKLQDVTAELDAAKKQNASHGQATDEELEATKEQLAAKEAELAAAVEETAQLQEALTALEERLQAGEAVVLTADPAELKAAKAELEAAKARLEATNTELEEVKQLLAASEQRIQAEIEQQTKASSANDKTDIENDLGEQLQAALADAVRVREELAVVAAEREELRRDLSLAQNRLDAHQEESDRAARLAEDADDEAQRMRRAAQAAQAAAEQAATNARGSDRPDGPAAQALQEALQAAARAAERALGAEEAASQAKHDAEEARQTLAAAEDKASALRDELQQVAADLRAAGNDAAAAAAERDAARDATQALGSEVRQLRGEQTRLRAEAREASGLVEEVTELRNTVESLRARLASTQWDSAQQRMRARAARAELIATQDHMQKAADEAGALRDEVSRLREHSQETEQRLSGEKAQLSGRVSRLKDMLVASMAKMAQTDTKFKSMATGSGGAGAGAGGGMSGLSGSSIMADTPLVAKVLRSRQWAGLKGAVRAAATTSHMPSGARLSRRASIEAAQSATTVAAAATAAAISEQQTPSGSSRASPQRTPSGSGRASPQRTPSGSGRASPQRPSSVSHAASAKSLPFVPAQSRQQAIASPIRAVMHGDDTFSAHQPSSSSKPAPPSPASTIGEPQHIESASSLPAATAAMLQSSPQHSRMTGAVSFASLAAASAHHAQPTTNQQAATQPPAARQSQSSRLAFAQASSSSHTAEFGIQTDPVPRPRAALFVQANRRDGGESRAIRAVATALDPLLASDTAPIASATLSTSPMRQSAKLRHSNGQGAAHVYASRHGHGRAGAIEFPEDVDEVKLAQEAAGLAQAAMSGDRVAIMRLMAALLAEQQQQQVRTGGTRPTQAWTHSMNPAVSSRPHSQSHQRRDAGIRAHDTSAVASAFDPQGSTTSSGERLVQTAERHRQQRSGSAGRASRSSGRERQVDREAAMTRATMSALQRLAMLQSAAAVAAGMGAPLVAGEVASATAASSMGEVGNPVAADLAAQQAISAAEAVTASVDSAILELESHLVALRGQETSTAALARHMSFDEMQRRLEAIAVRCLGPLQSLQARARGAASNAYGMFVPLQRPAAAWAREATARLEAEATNAADWTDASLQADLRGLVAATVPTAFDTDDDVADEDEVEEDDCEVIGGAGALLQSAARQTRRHSTVRGVTPEKLQEAEEPVPLSLVHHVPRASRPQPVPDRRTRVNMAKATPQTGGGAVSSRQRVRMIE